MIKKLFVVSLLCIVISCAFSTRGGSSQSSVQAKSFQQTHDTIYVKRAPLTKTEKAFKDSVLKVYIGSIMQPYTDDLKLSNSKNITNLTDFIRGQGRRIDSVNTLRHIEIQKYQTVQGHADSTIIQSIIKDHRIDSLQAAVLRIEKKNTDANKIVQGINDLIIWIRNIALYAIGLFILVIICLTIFLEWIKDKKRRELKLLKQDE